MEITEYTDGRRIAKRYLGGMAIHDVNLDDGADSELVYTHRDHLGSMDVTTKVNELGIVNIDQTFSFNAWGERRDATVWSNPTVSVPLLRETTPRGFTGHEHIDHAGIIHMNGRIYDASLGRFLQADPVVQAPENTQNYNRYTYVLNNPLSYTDPSGYFFKSIGKFFKKYGRTLASIAITIYAPALGTELWTSIVAGAAAGYVSSGSLKGALIGAFSGAVFHGIGDYFHSLQHSNGLAAASTVKGFGHFQGIAEGVAYARNATLSLAQSIGKVIAHGTAGGVMSELQGGKFAHGFASAGVTQAFAKHIDNIGGGSRSIGAVAGRVSAAALVGGTASELSGGKFVNGAVTGAFSRAFNDEIEHKARNEYDSSDPNYHVYDVESLICQVDSVCNLDSVGLANRMHPAPGMLSNTAPVVDGQISQVQLGYSFGLDDFGPVVHNVSQDGLTVRNTTLPGHRLYPGYVERSVIQRGNNIFVRTFGEGVGPMRFLNEALSVPLWSGLVDKHVRYRVNLGYMNKSGE